MAKNNKETKKVKNQKVEKPVDPNKVTIGEHIENGFIHVTNGIKIAVAATVGLAIAIPCGALAQKYTEAEVEAGKKLYDDHKELKGLKTVNVKDKKDGSTYTAKVRKDGRVVKSKGESSSKKVYKVDSSRPEKNTRTYKKIG